MTGWEFIHAFSGEKSWEDGMATLHRMRLKLVAMEKDDRNAEKDESTMINQKAGGQG